MKKSILIFLIILFTAGCINETKTDEVIKFKTTDLKKAKNISEMIDEINKNPYDFLTPYDGFIYDNISTSSSDNRITVKASSKELEGDDIYLFIYENGSLILKSYSLEALPSSLKDEAVAIALSNEKVYRNAKGELTVRRILPHTAAKYYMAKELFSVTWHGDRIVSALVDVEDGIIVKTYFSE